MTLQGFQDKQYTAAFATGQSQAIGSAVVKPHSASAIAFPQLVPKRRRHARQSASRAVVCVDDNATNTKKPIPYRTTTTATPIDQNMVQWQLDYCMCLSSSEGFVHQGAERMEDKTHKTSAYTPLEIWLLYQQDSTTALAPRAKVYRCCTYMLMSFAYLMRCHCNEAKVVLVFQFWNNLLLQETVNITQAIFSLLDEALLRLWGGESTYA